MKTFYFLFLFLIPFPSAAQGWDWFIEEGFMEYSHAQTLHKGKQGDFYLTALLSDSVQSSPMPYCEFGSHSRSNFIKHYDLDGNLLWEISNAHNIFTYSAVTANNNIVSLGTFYNVCGIGDTIVNGPPDYQHEYILTRFSETGELKHLKTFSHENHFSHVLTGPEGNYYIWCRVMDTLSIGDTVLYGTSETYIDDRYLLAFNSNDEFLWARINPFDPPSLPAIDAQGNFIWTGNYQDTLLFYDSLLLTSTNNHTKTFVMKTNPEMDILWLNTDFGSSVIWYKLSFDGWDNIYAAGYFSDSATINGITYYDTLHGYSTGGDMYIAKISSAGAIQYVTLVRHPYQQDHVHHVTATPAGEVFFRGTVLDSLIIGDSVIHSTIYGHYYDTYLAKLDGTGQLNWHVCATTPGYWFTTSMISDDWGNLYFGAGHSSTLGLGNYYDSVACSISGAPDHHFLMERYMFNPITLDITSAEEKTVPIVFPNPTSGFIYLKTNENEECRYSLFDFTGRCVTKSGTYSGKIDFSALPKGVYLLTIEAGQQRTSRKIVLQ